MNLDLDPRRNSVVTELQNLRGSLEIHNGKRVNHPQLSNGRWLVNVSDCEGTGTVQIVCSPKNLSTELPLGYVSKKKDFRNQASRSLTNLRNRASARSAFLSTSAQIRAAVSGMMRMNENEFNIRGESLQIKAARLKEITVSLFKAFDENQDGTIDKLEFMRGMLNFSPPIRLSRDELDLVFPLFDTNNDGSLSYKEFASMIHGDDAKFNSQLASKSNAFKLAMDTTTETQRKERIKMKTANPQTPKACPKISPMKLYRTLDRSPRMEHYWS
jgi:hypothetical protein